MMNATKGKESEQLKKKKTQTKHSVNARKYR